MMLLVDINSYFATLLQQENPKLRGKPVAVVKDLGRTCIIAASKEAKQFGIKTGCNVVEAQQLAPNLIQVPAEFDLYLSATQKLSSLFESLAPKVYIYSLDEAFIDVGDCQQHLYPDLIQLGSKIQDLIKQQLGSWVTANVGIGPNRLLAKMAAEIAPKPSVFEINEHNQEAILATVKFDDVCGIGARLASKLARMNVYHPYQIRFFSVEDLEPFFGPFWSRELLKIAYGEEPHHLQLLDQAQFTQQRMKSVSRSITMWQLLQDCTEVKRVLYNLAQEVIYKVRRMGLAGRQIGLGLYGSEGKVWRCHQTFQHFICHSRELFSFIDHSLATAWQRPFSPIKLKVYLSLLKSRHTITPSLLPDWQKQEALDTALDSIADQYGLFAIRPGIMLDQRQLIKPEVTGFLGDKEYQFKFR